MIEKNNLEIKIANATKWSAITEIVAKLVTPITNMILARLLTPEAFGVVATVTMITSFAEMLSDAGFQKYLIQHDFKDDNEKYKSTNVAYLTNLFLSIFLWLLILIFNNQIANIVGNPGLGYVLVIACLQLPITAFSSIQMALYKRDFDFKTLFFARLIGIFIPFVVTIPLAFSGLSYWALIIGSIVTQLSNAVILTFKSKWKPSLFFNWTIFTNMVSFTIWTLIESISIWLTNWIDIFIISKFLDDFYLGLYRTSITMVNALMSIVTAAIIPVLFSSLSRLQNNDFAYKDMFYKYQRVVSYLVFPLGVGIFLYRDFATDIMLGKQWEEASMIIGAWALTSVLLIPTSFFFSEVYRSKGNPKLSFISQMIHLLFLIPTCLISGQFGFWPLVYSRSIIRLQSLITGFIIMKMLIGFPIIKSLINISKPLIQTIIMGIFSYIIKQFFDTTIWYIISILLSVFFYFAMVYVFNRKDYELVKSFANAK